MNRSLLTLALAALVLAQAQALDWLRAENDAAAAELALQQARAHLPPVPQPQ